MLIPIPIPIPVVILSPFHCSNASPAPYFDGIFKGGGVLGAAYSGALLCLAKQGLWFKRVAGNSAGAITASLIATGFNAEEIDFLCAPKVAGRMRPATLPASTEAGYLSYEHFVDPPTSQEVLNSDARKHTLIYQFFRGPVFDTVQNIQTPANQMDALVKAIADAIIGILPTKISAQPPPFLGQLPPSLDVSIPIDQNKVRDLVRAGLPKGIGALLKDIFVNDDQHRDQFADILFSVGVILGDPKNAIFVPRVLDFMWNGGLLKGDEFLNRISTVLAIKGVHTFNDLPMELVIIASDVTAASMLVYSKQADKTMSVAEAVRRSMSIPFIFRPRIDANNGHEIMDGGLCDNLPVWPYLIPTNIATTNTPGDIQRPKLVFSLDDSVDNASSGCTPAPGASMPDLLGANGQQLTETRLFNRIMAVNNLQTSHSASGPIMVELLKTNPNVHLDLVNIGLKGYYWLDFIMDTGKFNGMACRGWNATWTILQQKYPALVSAPTVANPYHV